MTQINPNQINGGVKILNVVQNGTLYRTDGTIFRNFSYSGYLTIGGVVQKGIFSQTQNILDFGAFFSTASSWEFNGSFKLESLSTSKTIIRIPNVEKGFILWYDTSMSALRVGGYITSGIDMTNLVQANTKYFFRYEFTGNQYNFYLNTDGETYDNTTLRGTEITTDKFRDGDSFGIGFSFTNGDEIDISDWSIKKNGEYWWKGVETI